LASKTYLYRHISNPSYFYTSYLY